MNKWIILIISFFFVVGLQAQEDRINYQSAKGLSFGIADEALIESLMSPVPGIGKGGNTREMLLRQTVKAYMMPIRKTGPNGSDISYALASCLEYYVNLDRNYKVNLSPDYIYLNLRNAGKGMTIEEGFRFLSNDGTVSAAILPYDSETLTSGVYATQKYRIGNYLHLFREVTSDRQRVFEVRKALMRGHPVLVELKAAPGIKALAGERFYRPEKGGDQLFPMIVVSYDEELEAFELRSCWGRNWGDGGYAWISFEDFGRQAVNGYVVLPDSNN